MHFCILALGSRAWCARIPNNSSLVHLEKGVRERSKEKRRSVVEDLGRWAGKTEQQREKGAQNGAQPSWQRERPVLEDLGSWAAETKHPKEKPHGEVRSAKTEHETHCQGDNEHNSGEGYPTPPHPTQPKPDPSSVRAFASEHERYYPTPPHPTPPHQLLRVHTWDSRRGVACACAREPKNACAGEAQTGGRSLWEDGVGKRCTRL